MNYLVAGAVLALAGCSASADPDMVTLPRGLWRMQALYGRPQIDGRTFDDLRWKMPPDRDNTTCGAQRFGPKSDFGGLFGFKAGACRIAKASVGNGRIDVAGSCPKLASDLAQGGGRGIIDLHSMDSWIKYEGSYDDRSLEIDATVVITATESRGVTSRLTIPATYRAQRIGDCP